MNTIIKSGAVLIMPHGTFCEYDVPPFALYHDGTCVMYGDLHCVDGALILHTPPQQAPVWNQAHGTVNFGNHRYFYRKADPFSVLVLPRAAVKLRQSAIHESYWPRLVGNWLPEETKLDLSP